MTNIKQADGEGRKLCVLKFGSSVLETETDYRTAAQEVYRHVRDGEKIVAVVSALAGETDELIEQAARVGGEPSDRLVARLERVGELRSAALMALALERIGVRACTLDPHEMGLMAAGEPLDADLTALDVAAVEAKLARHEAVVVPGFTAGHDEHGVVTLGRGGTDLSAVFFAARLGSKRVRLLKDVDGVYTDDPAKNPNAERYGALSYETAAEASKGLIQPKAIDAAKVEGIAIEVAAVGHGEATLIAAVPARRERPLEVKKLTVALLGCGSVGTGVLEYLRERDNLFALNPVLVRNPGSRRREAGLRFTTRLEDALDGADLVIELMGGADRPAEIITDALRRGVHVVTANKAAVAAHYDALREAAQASGAFLAYSASVGGGVPVLELVERLRAGPGIAALEGVMNGTCNFLLGKLGEGWDFDDAVAKAQELGFAEADPAADVDGHDAADKLAILVREAFGVALDPAQIEKQSLGSLDPGLVAGALRRGEVLKQVGRARLRDDGTIEASVKVEALPASHPLASVKAEENRFLVTTTDGAVHAVYGKGAGRWPSAAAVFADVMDLERKLAAEALSAPLRLSA